MGIEGTIQFNDFHLGDKIHFKGLFITSIKYKSDEKILGIEDSLKDFQLSLIGLNSGLIKDNNYLTHKDLKGEPLVNKLREISSEFESLLDSSIKEEEIQIYLKNHPILLQPYSKIITKQKLGEDFITDFVLSNTLDQGIKYTFVEIERVSMPIFTKKGEFTSDFKHCEKQTLDWDIWLEKNKSYLQNKLIDLETPEFLIVAGRTNNQEEEKNATLRAWNRRQKNLVFYSYDDLITRLNELIINLEKEIFNK